jgi:amidase
VLRDYVGAGREPAVERNLTTVITWLRESGTEVVDPIQASPDARIRRAEHAILLSEFRVGLAQYLRGVRYGPRSLDELIAFNETHQAQVMPYFGQDLLRAARYAPAMESAVIVAAKSVLTDYEQRIDALFKADRLDALLAPANGRAWITDERSSDRFTVGSSSMAAVTGYPSLALPTALVDDLPLGVLFVARPYREALLLELASRLEHRRGEFPSPRFLRSVIDSPESLPASEP